VLITATFVVVCALLAERVHRILKKPAPDERSERLIVELAEEVKGLRSDLQEERLARAATAAVEKFAAQQAKRGAPVSSSAPIDPADDDEITRAVVASLPQYASRRPAPLADPDLIGSEDAADEAASRKLGPEDETPPRGSRASRSVAVYHPEPTNEGGPV
jgi:hypothetical protein